MQKILFIVVLEEQHPQPNFSLKNLPGESKIDVAARNVLNIFPRLQQSTNISYYAVFTKTPAMILQVNGLNPREDSYDEIEVASFIRDALQKTIEKFTTKSLNNTENFCWYNITSFQMFIKELAKLDYTIYYLHEEGKSLDTYLKDIRGSEKMIFILGGRQDISTEHEQFIEEIGNKKVTLGERSYLASTCILKTLFEIDKMVEK